MKEKDSARRIDMLRSLLRRDGVYGFMLPVADPYMNEYPPACYRRLEWLTGFSGSAGMAVILPEAAALFVDGRYVLQAKQQVVDDELYAIHNIADKTPQKWLCENAETASVIAYDPWLHTRSGIMKMEREIANGPGLKLKPLESNPIDNIWKDRPEFAAADVVVYPQEYSGRAGGEKREEIAKIIKNKNVDAALITAPDSVCWLLDLRGGDVPHTPLVLAMALLYADGNCDLFIGKHPLSAGVKEHLGSKVQLYDIREMQSRLLTLKQKRLLLDNSNAPMRCYQYAVNSQVIVVNHPDPCLLPKACKNPTELAGIRSAHIRDGVALSRFLCWLDRQIANKQRVTELEVEEKLLEFRRLNRHFHGNSFDTIAGSGANGAIVHYRATVESNRSLCEGEIFLLDSGGQYTDGTTDVTRTITIGGKATGQMRTDFTLVLKGHISLATARFPVGTTGSQLDVLARNHLWQEGLDYDHGTGHGVGHYLNVHESPQRISKRGGGGEVALQPGMVLSNEPGCYREREYGIRIENLVAVCEDEENKEFLRFETLTCAPIDTRLVEKSMLTESEIKWLNDYHFWVKETLFGFMESEEERRWLNRTCAAI